MTRIEKIASDPLLTFKNGVEKELPSIAKEAVFVKTASTEKFRQQVLGYDFNNGLHHHELLQSFLDSGFQATNFGLAVKEIKRMIECREQPLPEDILHAMEEDQTIPSKKNCTIFLGFTSNMSSCGVREVIRFLVEHKMVDCLVSTTGGVEEDLIKCLAPTFVGDFTLKGSDLRDQGINRIGNLLVPNDNYCLFENWVMPLLDTMLEEQHTQGVVWSPSKMIRRFGEAINNPQSICYWAAKNDIPFFCPALTDGSIGDMIFFHTYRNPGLVIDLVQDIQGINSLAVNAVNSGIIIVGGGLVKHHICNANVMRNGADFAVYINTANEFDGSDSGARPDEAVSWGKIKKTAKPVKVFAEASLAFPLLVAETFVRKHYKLDEA